MSYNYKVIYTIPGTRVEVNKIKAYSLKKCTCMWARVYLKNIGTNPENDSMVLVNLTSETHGTDNLPLSHTTPTSSWHNAQYHDTICFLHRLQLLS